MSVISVKHLNKYYGKSRGLEDASLEVKSGEIFGFIGPNGAGKTTLIRILMGLLDKDKGEATIFDQPCHMDSYIINQAIGYLPSEALFFNEYKVKDIIAFYSKFHHVDETYKRHIIKELDIDIEKRVSELSFGNKKKLGILIAMMHQPKLLILDEPTTGLDPLIQQKFLNLLLEAKKQQTTVFLSSHVLSDVQKVCDRVALIKDGKVILTEEMKVLHEREHKVVQIRPALTLDLPDISDEIVSKDEMYCHYHGEMKQLMKKLAALDIKDVIIRDVTLEEIFLSYYEEGDQDVR